MDRIVTQDAPAAIGPYSQAIKVGNMLFTSGQIALKPDGTMVEANVALQTRQVLCNLEAVLKAAEATLGDVVKTTVYLKNINDFVAMNNVYAEVFNGHTPARSTVEVARLPKDALVEIDIVAMLS